MLSQHGHNDDYGDILCDFLEKVRVLVLEQHTPHQHNKPDSSSSQPPLLSRLGHYRQGPVVTLVLQTHTHTDTNTQRLMQKIVHLKQRHWHCRAFHRHHHPL